MPKGNPGIPKKRHAGEFKQKAVEHMRENNLSYRETGRIFGFRHEMLIAWERIYLEEGVEGLYVERRGRATAKEGSAKEREKKLDKKVEEDLIAENQRLRMENDYLKKLDALVQEEKLQNRKRK